MPGSIDCAHPSLGEQVLDSVTFLDNVPRNEGHLRLLGQAIFLPPVCVSVADPSPRPTRDGQRSGARDYRSIDKAAFTRGLQKLVPEIRKEDLVPGDAGVRALAVGRNGELLDDFVFAENEWAVNVLNAPSPAATACLSIGDSVAEKALKRFD